MRFCVFIHRCPLGLNALHHPKESRLVSDIFPGIQSYRSLHINYIMVQYPEPLILSNTYKQPDERNFIKADFFIPERWTTKPELILNRAAFIPFIIGIYMMLITSHPNIITEVPYRTLFMPWEKLSNYGAPIRHFENYSRIRHKIPTRLNI